MRHYFSLSILLLCSLAVNAQRLASPEYMGAGITVQYENDLFGHTDYYYTQGLQLSFNQPVFKNFLLSGIMWRLSDTVYNAGIGIEQDCYTPMSILSDTILHGDRPFAAGLMAHYFVTSGKGVHSVLTSRLSLGIVGAAAGGYEMQRGIHENTGNIIPHGWQYQIRNDAIVNYEAAYRYRLLSSRSKIHNVFPGFAVDGLATINAGTYLDKLSVGLRGSAGIFHLNRPRSFDLYYEVRVAAVGYDATLQGGFFNSNSPYVIASDQVERTTFQQKAGLSIRYGAILLQGCYTWLSQEFEGGKSHAWGGLSAAVLF